MSQITLTTGKYQRIDESLYAAKMALFTDLLSAIQTSDPEADQWSVVGESDEAGVRKSDTSARRASCLDFRSNEMDDSFVGMGY